MDLQNLEREKIDQAKMKLYIISAILIIWVALVTLALMIIVFLAMRRLKSHFYAMVGHVVIVVVTW